MKTTLEIADPILRSAKALARRRRTTLRNIVENALIREIHRDNPDSITPPFRPLIHKGRGLNPAFQNATWQEIRDTIYPPARP